MATHANETIASPRAESALEIKRQRSKWEALSHLRKHKGLSEKEFICFYERTYPYLKSASMEAAVRKLHRSPVGKRMNTRYSSRLPTVE